MDNDDELKAKAREMAEMLFDHRGEFKGMAIQRFLSDIEEHIREFYAANGQSPVFPQGLRRSW